MWDILNLDRFSKNYLSHPKNVSLMESNQFLNENKHLKPIELRAAELDNANSQVDALTFRRKLSFDLNRLLSEKQQQPQSAQH